MAASGVVLETLSWKKLGIFVSILLLGQIVSFLIGGLVAPSVNTATSLLTQKCIDINPSSNNDKWFFMREIVEGEFNCHELPDDDKNGLNMLKLGTGKQIVFSAIFPLPRDGIYHNMSRLFQQIVGILQMDIMYLKDMKMEESSMITMDIRLGYRNKGQRNWTQLARSLEHRPMHCLLDKDAKQKLLDSKINLEEMEGRFYDCDILPLFSLGNTYYDEYLVNIRLPSSIGNEYNKNLGLLKDVWIIEMHQNGGFTIVWFAMKSVMTLITLAALGFFINRIHQLDRPMNLLEQTIISLGVVTTLLNVPVEIFSLIYDVSFWLVLSDIRQGGFYAMLLCFWVVFIGEHMLDDIQDVCPRSSIRQRLYHYSSQLIPVGSASVFLFLFELSERGVQLMNPFYSVWSHTTTARLAIGFIVIAFICGVLYFVFITYKTIQAIRQMLGKRSVIATMPDSKQKMYKGIIYRFTAFILYTMFCSTMTVVFFLFSQIDESQWKWGERHLEYTSAYVTGVFGMWNIYVISIMSLYAPSHKYKDLAARAICSTAESGNLLSNSRGAVSSVNTNTDEVVVMFEKPADKVNLTKRSKMTQLPKDPQQSTSKKKHLRAKPNSNPLETLVQLQKTSKN